MKEVEGYLTVDGKPIVLGTKELRGWSFCRDGEQPSIVLKSWYMGYVNRAHFGFVEI